MPPLILEMADKPDDAPEYYPVYDPSNDGFVIPP